MSRIFIKTCKVCHKEFETGRSNRQCCSEECKKQNNIINARKNYNKIRAIRKITKKEKVKKLTTVDIAVKAKEAGMSYGQYVARMNI